MPLTNSNTTQKNVFSSIYTVNPIRVNLSENSLLFISLRGNMGLSTEKRD